MNRKLKARIIEKFGTQGDFSAAVNRTEPFISRVVRGRQSLTNEEMRRWCSALKCDVKDVFTDQGGKVHA